MSPQWERGELVLDSAGDNDKENDGLVARDTVAKDSPKDYISVIRRSSLWILIRNFFGPPDVLV